MNIILRLSDLFQVLGLCLFAISFPVLVIYLIIKEAKEKKIEEKMKCCGNCKYCNDTDESQSKYDVCMSCETMNKWEVEE